MTVAGQPTVNYAYDDANRLTEITQDTASVLFGFDSNGRRTSLTLPNGVMANYSYDAASQLLGITYSTPAVVLGDLAYKYDVAGRRVNVTGSFARTELPQAVSATAYNGNNQLTQWGGATLTYDLNGNLQSDGASSFTWDGRNQLVAMNLGGAAFLYDPFGRRVSKTISDATTNYLYDGVNPVQELNGTMPTANLLTGRVDEYFARTDATGAASFLPDVLGSTLALADSTGTIQTQYAYEPFGKTSIASAASTNAFAYTGRELDGTGLYYYRARYYNASFGRFLSEDPIHFGINFYTYVTNNPATFIDPLGLRNCTTTPLGLVCYPDNNPGTTQLDPHIPDPPTPEGLPKMPRPVPMPGSFCEPGTDCHDNITGGLPGPTSGGTNGFVPNPCQGWDFDSVPLPYKGPTFTCSGKRDPCKDAETKFINACEKAGCKGMVYNTRYTGSISASCCQKR